MAVGFASFEIARTGMYVNERGLFVTGHNISNVNTPGYVRQQAMITSGPYHNQNSQYQMGLGADIQQIRQIRHMFLDNIYRAESTTLGYWESRAKTYNDVQAILAEPMGSGLQDVMNQFWDSWQELSKEPDSLTARAVVRQRAEAFVYHVNHMGNQLNKLQDDLNSEIRVRIDEVNNITRQIAQLNVEILKVEVSKDTANDFRDTRNTLVDRLSKLLNVEVNEMQDSQLDITIGGYFLVSKGKSTNLYPAESQAGGLYYVPKIEGTDIEVPVKNGIIKGLMESRGEVLGATGSVENGTPDTKADIVFAIDVSSASDEYLENVKASIESYVEGVKRMGLDYNYRLIIYGGENISHINHGKDIDGLLNEVNNIAEAVVAGTSFGDVVDIMENIDHLREGTNKYTLVFTGEGGSSTISLEQGQDYMERLNSIGINTSIVKDGTHFDSVTVEAWDVIGSGTGGKLHNIEVEDFQNIMTTIYRNINDDINGKISIVPDSLNILPHLKKKLNALINILVREINYIHTSGKTLGNPPLDGQDFFVPINPKYPLEMGNIKLNDNLTNLNNIVASYSGDSGDNSIAIKIANLRQVTLIKDFKGILSTDGYYQAIILGVGSGGSEAERISENQRKLVLSADSHRQSIMGVSMDEEMSNMLKFKFAYNASARAINVVDEMIETIVTRMGIVGR
ncbi:UNVERIFIED_CONTAM: flagellar hook-associated protein 1 FlgK [Acetivibrio alkalicellulosi]